MPCHCIPHTQVPSGSRLFTDYLYQYPKVSEFYPLSPLSEASFQTAAQSIPRDAAQRAEVISVLREQNQRLGSSQATFDNLSKLEDPNCVVVATGQQTGLFTGPAFVLYKSLTAVKLARELTKSGMAAVPVFWLATEDHDLDEVNHCFVRDADGAPRQLTYQGQIAVTGTSVGSVIFDESISAVIEETRALVGDLPFGEEVMKNLAECYRPGQSFSHAFGEFLARTLSAFGIILLDPMDRRLHRLSAPVFRAAIERGPELVEAVTARNQRLVEAGYEPQVHVPENFSFLFVRVDGQRRALRMRDGQFATAQGDTYTGGQLLERLEKEPETITANVLLRPLMQDTLLPTVSYVGGPSELAYFAQAAPVYERVLGRMPVIFPRASFTLMDAPVTRLSSKYGLGLPDIFSGKQALRDKMSMRFLPPGLTELFQKTAANLESDLQALQASLTKLDPTLADAAANSGRKMQYQLQTMEHKAMAAIQNRSEQIERDAVRLENSLYPRKTPQERLYSGVSFLARYGSGLLNDLCEQIPIHSAQHQVIEL